MDNNELDKGWELPGFQTDDLDRYTSDIDHWEVAADQDSLTGRVMNKDYATLKDDLDKVVAKKIVSKIDSEKENISMTFQNLDDTY
jgi:hypothetical protein